MAQKIFGHPILLCVFSLYRGCPQNLLLFFEQVFCPKTGFFDLPMLILLKWKLPAEVDAPAPAKTTVCLEEARRPQR